MKSRSAQQSLFPLFETIAIKKGKAQNLALHQARYRHSLLRYYGSVQGEVNLAELIQVPTNLIDSDLIRCRIDYNHSQQKVQFFPYQPRRIRHFQPLICEQVNYALKYSDRTQLDALFAQRGSCDEIIIVQNGKLTDCSIGNLALKRQGEWFTPDTPLLFGTKRQQLLQEQRIHLRSLSLTQLDLFEEICVINALNDLA